MGLIHVDLKHLTKVKKDRRRLNGSILCFLHYLGSSKNTNLHSAIMNQERKLSSVDEVE